MAIVRRDSSSKSEGLPARRYRGRRRSNATKKGTMRRRREGRNKARRNKATKKKKVGLRTAATNKENATKRNPPKGKTQKRIVSTKKSKLTSSFMRKLHAIRGGYIDSRRRHRRVRSSRFRHRHTNRPESHSILIKRIRRLLEDEFLKEASSESYSSYVDSSSTRKAHITSRSERTSSRRDGKTGKSKRDGFSDESAKDSGHSLGVCLEGLPLDSKEAEELYSCSVGDVVPGRAAPAREQGDGPALEPSSLFVQLKVRETVGPKEKDPKTLELKETEFSVGSDSLLRNSF